MASRKQKKPRAARRVVQSPPTEKTLGESIIEQMLVLNAVLTDISTTLRERNAMLSVVTSETAKQTASIAKAAAAVVADPPPVAARVAQDPLPAGATVAATPRKRGRPSKAELAARAASASQGEPEALPTKAPEVFTQDKFPQMCACGVREDLPPHLHAKGCPVHHKQEPVPEHRASPTSEPTPPPPAAQATEAVPAPTHDDVRAVAISFIGKHGKEKLGELFKGFGFDKLTSIPAEKLPAVLAAIQKEV